MTKFQRLLKLRCIILSVILLTAVTAVIHTAVYVTSRNFIEEELTLNAQGIALIIAQVISEDIEDYKDFLQTVDDYKSSRGLCPQDTVSEGDCMPPEIYENNPYYQRMQRFFTQVKENARIKFIYTYRPVSEGSLEYILDAEPVGNENHSAPCSVHSADPANVIVFHEGKPARYGLTHYDNWGYLLGAHAPIVDRNGEPFGAAGVDICGATLANHLNRLQLILLAVYVVIIGVTLFIVTRFSIVIIEPLLKDRLTGAYMKRYADRLIQEEITAALKEKTGLTLMMLDLDHFKEINDTYGHNFGDKVLSALSETIQRVFRQKDYFIRYGGEEFIALFPGVDKEHSLNIAERIRLAVANTPVMDTAKNIAVNVTVSIGVAVLHHSTATVCDLIDHADKALYAAKKHRNCVSFYVPEMEQVLNAQC